MIPRVYSAIHAIAAALSTDGVPKERLNARDDYLYRSIDDVLKRLSPLLAEHRLCVLPRVLERTQSERLGEDGRLLVSVSLRTAFDLVSVEDGSVHVIEACGEALDGGDKATAKAMQSAYKYAMLQTFCVPSAMTEDADAQSHRLVPCRIASEPEGGWQAWADDLQAMIARCATSEEIAAAQESSRSLLQALSRERPDLYKQVGETVAARRQVLCAGPGQFAMAAARKGAASKPRRAARAAAANGSAAHG